MNAIKTPRHIDMNLVNAQQARQILDKLIGFQLSPLLSKVIISKSSLSAGRVQSVALKAVCERETDINNFKNKDCYKVSAQFNTNKEQIELIKKLEKKIWRERYRRQERRECSQTTKCSTPSFGNF